MCVLYLSASKVSLLFRCCCWIHGDGVMGRSTPSTRLVCESPCAIDATRAQRRINTSYIQIRSKVTQKLLIERRLDGQLTTSLLLLPS
jgi:hypothetical protein